MRKRFGELLLEGGLINQEQLADALAYQQRTRVRLGAALVARGHITEPQLVSALGAALRVPVVSLRKLSPDPQALRMVSLKLCSEHDLFPYAVRKERGRTVLTVATSDPLNFRLLDELGFMCDANIEAVLAPASDIDVAIREHYGPRLARPYMTSEVRLALEQDGDGAEMTIYRRGGGTETINTETGSLSDVPPATPSAGTPRTPRPRADSAMLLTEEVVDETPVDTASSLPTQVPIPLTAVKPPPTIEAPVAPNSYGGAPVRVPPPPQVPAAPPIAAAPTPAAAPPPRAEVATAPMTFGAQQQGFDDALGALIDAAHEADHTEAILRLERKFWALMRVLAKKGILTNDDFVAELGEEEKWRR